ncbi:Essential protein Yae1 N-terminal [Arabidopsis suecica]|uniref:Essential protein Yae1 N-terminal n=1 Tax=Arabidopsis suecica TaxID=45249 RepID=A0A8T1YPP1_ARASU|nr:Essential protein Yae1 N-terminal [Arabidopsis suecica]
MGLLPGKKLLRSKVITLAIRNQFLMPTSLVLLEVFPDELREKLIDEQETRDKFRKLHSCVHALSTEVAMKRFYETLTTKQGEGKSGDQGSDSGSGSGVNATTIDLGSYVTDLSSLLDKSRKIDIILDT